MPSIARRPITLLLAYLTLTACMSPVGAQAASPDVPEPSTAILLVQHPDASSTDAIRARAQRLREARALLNDPDPIVRLAALNEMLKSGDPAERQLGTTLGFASADHDLRALALRQRLQPPTELSFDLVGSTKQATEELARGEVGSHLVVRVETFTEATGLMKILTRFGYGSAQVSGTSVSINARICRGNFRLGDAGTLTGSLTCIFSSGRPVSVNAVARLL